MKKLFNIAIGTFISLALIGCASTTDNSSANSTLAQTTVAETSTAVESSTAVSKGSSETVYPISITTYDADGKEITQVFEKAPERIITNNLSSTELLIDLGLQDKIVGMLNPDNEITDDYAAAIAAIPHIGDKKSVSKEVVLSNNPDIIIGRNMMFSDKSLGTIDSWNENSIPVYTQKASVSNMKQSLENVIEDIRNIGIIFNVQEKANAYADELEKKINAVASSDKKSGELKNALIMCAYNDSTFGAYKSALQESILNTLGYTNVATGTSDLTLENLVTMAPEVIIYVTSDRNKEMDTNAVELMKNNTVLSDVPAIANDKIMTISYDEFMDYGASSVKALEDINTFLNK